MRPIPAWQSSSALAVAPQCPVLHDPYYHCTCCNWPCYTQEHLQIISTCKHFFGYDIETGRSGNDVNISARMLVEYFLPAFDWDCRL